MKQVIITWKGYCAHAHKDPTWNVKALRVETINRVLEVFHDQSVLNICIADEKDDAMEGSWRHIPFDQLREWKVRL